MRAVAAAVSTLLLLWTGHGVAREGAGPVSGRAAGPSRPVPDATRLAQIRLGQPVPTSPPPSGGSGGLVMATTPDQTLAALDGLGFTDGSVIDQDGGKHLRVMFDGNPMYIWHDECDGEACRRITFYAGFGKQDTVDDAFLSAYNLDNVVTKMYRESDGNIALTMYSILDGGVGPAWIKGEGERWLRYYKKALTYKPASGG